MFWKKKPKLPITSEDKAWVDDCLKWLRSELSERHFLEIKTVTPTKDFYNRTFDGTEDDAHFILKRTMELMCIKDVDIELEFFSDNAVHSEDGSILTTPSEEIDGSWDSAAGIYEMKDGELKIYIEREQLKRTISLIATIAHELAHQILIGENRIEKNDEYLTDLVAITYGYGIFLGNSRFDFSTFSTFDGGGWQSSAQGYLPEQVIAYTMAKLSFERGENIDFNQFLEKEIKTYFLQSYNYLETN
ncbi:hypothetical protein Q2T40_16940 [Winogradskyella maritima]|uniref:DUF2268 domain-containing protein n=1 Tax=Winogradskyella maritima TaxID=1517766 RepID=A0ABV8AJ07_9FLAO|nr:hypothetical protein [Winogradskyella maritima]